ncbi:MAG: acyl-CoA dehydrogenase family protein [Candidatus Bathyarchaeia archaeon]
MSTSNFFSDNDDLIFKLRNCIDWKRILSLREEIGKEGSPFETPEEAVEVYLDMLRDPIGEIAANRIAPRASDIDRDGCQLRDGVVLLPEGMIQNMKDLIDADLMGLTLPREYGGLNLPTTFYSAAIEIISRADASLMNLFGMQGIAETINHFGSEEMKKRYLPLFASGKISGAMVLTEPECGSDLMSIRTQATFDEETGKWTIKGTKRFITNGCGDCLLVLARSEDPKKYGGGRGLSLFLVEKGEAVKIRRIEHKMGINGSPTCEIYFDNAPAQLIGERGKGLTRYVNWLMSAAAASRNPAARSGSPSASKTSAIPMRAAYAYPCTSHRAMGGRATVPSLKRTESEESFQPWFSRPVSRSRMYSKYPSPSWSP